MLFMQELTLLGYFLLRAALHPGAEPDDELLHSSTESAADERDDERPPDPEHAPFATEDDLDDDTRFLFDVVARRNESIIQRIDALDNGLIAVAVAVVVVTLFVADKWFEFDPDFRFACIFFLIESAICALFGYLTTQLIGGGAEDVVRLDDFTVDFSEARAKATFLAISNITRSGKTNVKVRRYKRAFITIATLLVIVAASVVVAARAMGELRTH
ncbi:MAG: hypothetical protein M3169_00920 [Candidatus Eremiobacteraeota bacterium]|nr:hypothetical protein [Candidatus Eremiobacteraeota bacterium]